MTEPVHDPIQSTRWCIMSGLAREVGSISIDEARAILALYHPLDEETVLLRLSRLAEQTMTVTSLRLNSSSTLIAVPHNMLTMSARDILTDQ